MAPDEPNRRTLLFDRLKHAFAVEPSGATEPTEDERQLVNRLCRAIVRRGLTSPALIALECSRPLNFIGSQFLLFVAPIAEIIFPRDKYRTLIRFLERRGSIEYTCQQLERMSGASDGLPGEDDGGHRQNDE